MTMKSNDPPWWFILLYLMLLFAFAALCEYLYLVFVVKVLRSLGVGI